MVPLTQGRCYGRVALHVEDDRVPSLARNRSLFGQEGCVSLWDITKRNGDIVIALERPQAAKSRRAKVHRFFEHCFKNRLQDAGRRINDLQNFRGRGLLLQRLAQIVGARPQLSQQSRVLDGDNSLAGEALQQFDLFLTEWPHLLSIDRDDANQLIFLEHRHSD